MQFGVNPQGRVGAASPGCHVPCRGRSPRVSSACCNMQDVLWIHKVSAACLKSSHLRGVRKGKFLVEAQQSHCRRGAAGPLPGSPRSRVPSDAQGCGQHRAELSAPHFINILDAGKTGWVLIVVLLGSFCKDLYHSVSV